MKKRAFVSQLPTSIALQPKKRRTGLRLFLIAVSLILTPAYFLWKFQLSIRSSGKDITQLPV